MKKITFLLFLVFQLTFAQTPVQFYQNTPVGGTNFGYSLAVNGNEILASSSSWTLFGPPSIGKAFLFTLNNDVLTQSNTFLPDEAMMTDYFGSVLAIGNNTIAIGAWGRDDNFENAGAVYIYHKTAAVYQFLQKITAPDGGTNGYFGGCVRISNNQLFVSAVNLATPDITTDGTVYIYDFDGNHWNFSQKIITEGAAKIEVENNLLVTSSYDGYKYSNVSFYKKNGNTWDFASTLELGNPGENAIDFSLSGNNIYTISDRHFISEYDETINQQWGLHAHFPLGQEADDQIYTKIEVAGDKMFLGSTSYILLMHRRFPVLYYSKSSGTWTYQNQFRGNGPIMDDFFGSAMESQGDSLIIGAPNEEMTPLNGRAYYLDLTTLATDGFEKKLAFIYPNPTQNKIHIENNSKVSVKKASVFSVTGNLLFETTGNTNEVSLEKFADGIYFVKLSFDNSSEETFKIIKN